MMFRISKNALLSALLFSTLVTLILLLMVRSGHINFDSEINDWDPDYLTEAAKSNELFHDLSSEELESYKDKVYHKLASNKKANACIVTVLDETDLSDWRVTMRSIEDRFNSKFNYDYVFLSAKPFSNHFIESVSYLTKSKMKFGRIPQKHWKIPDFINSYQFRKVRNEYKENGIVSGDSVAYRKLSRYNAGFFFRHELLKPYDFYMRVEPGSLLSCDMTYTEESGDPFVYMHNNDKLFGFTISVKEISETIPNLFPTVKTYFQDQNLNLNDATTAYKLVTEDGINYNGCHFWSFELGNLNLFRSQQYLDYFNYIDTVGKGIFYERWGEGPIKTLYLTLTQPKEKLHLLNGIGIHKFPYTHCPTSITMNLKCSCAAQDTNDFAINSCNKDWIKLMDIAL